MYVGGFVCQEENEVKFDSSYGLTIDRVFGSQAWELG
jgi:hypothetical protein